MRYVLHISEFLKGGPGWVMIFPYGTIHHMGVRKFDRTTAQTVVQNFKNNIIQRDVPVNVEHSRLHGRVGRVVELDVRDDGLYAKLELSPLGKKLLSEKRFRYLSPEIAWEWKHPFTGKTHKNVLVGLALTNYPALLGKTAIFSKAAEEFRTRTYLARLLKLLKERVDPDVWRQLVRIARGAAGGSRAAAPSFWEKMAIRVITPEALRHVTDKELLSLHRRCHQLISRLIRKSEFFMPTPRDVHIPGTLRIRPGKKKVCVCPKCGHETTGDWGKPCVELKCPKCGTTMLRRFAEGEFLKISVEDVVNAHTFIVGEMERRGMKHRVRAWIDRETKRLRQMLKSAPHAALIARRVDEPIVLVEDFLKVEDGETVRLEVNAPMEDGRIRVPSDVVQDSITRHLDPTGEESIHYIASPTGPHGDSLSLYDLVLRPKGTIRKKATLRLTFVGTGATPSPRKDAALLVEYLGKRVLFDCGPDHAGKLKFKADAIFLTDHDPEFVASAKKQAEKWGVPVYSGGSHTLGKIRIQGFRVVHTRTHPTYGYIVRAGGYKIIYAPEIWRITCWDELRGADLMILDGAGLRDIRFAGGAGGHRSVLALIQQAQKNEIKRIVLTHVGKQVVAEPEAVRRLGAEIAEDGWVLELAAKRKDRKSYPGIYLVQRHARLLAQGRKKIILKAIPVTKYVGQPILVVSKDGAYALIRLHAPERVNQQWIVAHKDEHCVTPEEIRDWWGDRPYLYAYRFDVLARYKQPRPARIPRGVQTWLRRVLLKGLARPFSRFRPMKPQMKGFTEFFEIEEILDWARPRFEAGIAVEQKYSGFRTIARGDGSGKIQIYFEDAQADRTKAAPEMAEVLRRIREPFVLDMDAAIYRDGKPLPRIQLMAMMAKEPKLEPGDIVVGRVFDILFYRKDLTGLPWRERRRYLEEFYHKYLANSRAFRLSPVRIVRTEAELRRAARWGLQQPGSEGIVAKDTRSKYNLKGSSPDWAKLKRVIELKVIVLDKHPSKGGGWSYGCGIAGDGELDNVVRFRGKSYVRLGQTFNTKIDAAVGEIITVQPREIIPLEGKIVWTETRVIDVDRSRTKPYTLAQTIDLAKRGGVWQQIRKSSASVWVVPQFVSIVGSSVHGQGRDVDVVIRAHRMGRDLIIDPQNIYLPIRNVYNPEKDRDVCWASDVHADDVFDLVLLPNVKQVYIHKGRVSLFTVTFVGTGRKSERRQAALYVRSQRTAILIDAGPRLKPAHLPRAPRVVLSTGKGDEKALRELAERFGLEVRHGPWATEDTRVRAFRVAGGLAYRIETGGFSVCYSPWTRPPATAVRQADLAILPAAQPTDIPKLQKWARELGAKRVVFTGVTAAVEPSVSSLMHRGYECAFDGQTISIVSTLRPGHINFRPLRTKGGWGRLNFEDVDVAWEKWASQNTPVAVEPDFPGFRVSLHKLGADVWIKTEEGEELADILPAAAKVLKSLPGDLIFDATVMVLEDGDAVPARRIQEYLRGGKSIRNYRVFIHECIYRGSDLHNLTWQQRQKHLRLVLPESRPPVMRLSPIVVATRDGLREAVKKALATPHAIGVWMRNMAMKYPLSGESIEVAKLRRFWALVVRVVGVNRVRDGWIYRVVLAGGRPIGSTFVSNIQAKEGDLLMVKVDEVWKEGDSYRWNIAIPVAVNPEGKRPTSPRELEAMVGETPPVRFAERDEEGETRAEHAAKFWKENWHKLWPRSGKGRFVYQHHWRGLTEEETKLPESELLETGRSLHGDLRLEGNEALFGLTIFLGTAESNREGDRLCNLPPDDKLQFTWKLPQPKGWLDVGVDKPLVRPPGSSGATAEKWAKFFAIDRGTYELGVCREHSFEFFLRGELLRGRFLAVYAPVGDGRRWLVGRPKDQTPYAESRNLEDVLAELRAKGQKWLVWSKPGQKPVLYSVETGRPVRRARILKVDKAKQIVYGIVFVPGERDRDGDVLTVEDIEYAAHNYLMRRQLKVDLQHERILSPKEAAVIESWIAPVDFRWGDRKIKAGTWIAAVKIFDSDIWQGVLDGKITGFSPQGRGIRIRHE